MDERPVIVVVDDEADALLQYLTPSLDDLAGTIEWYPTDPRALRWMTFARLRRKGERSHWLSQTSGCLR